MMYCTVLKYLQIKYDSVSPTTMTGSDARTMGIPYPLRSGWLEKYGPNSLTEKQIDQMIAAVARRAKGDPQGSCLASMQLSRLEKAWQSSSGDGYKPPKEKKADAKKTRQAIVCVAETKSKHVYDGFYETREWRELRYKALVIHGPTCQCCGATRGQGVVIHVDHVKPRSKFPALQLDLSNLQILCADCNLGKSNKDQTDWR